MKKLILVMSMLILFSCSTSEDSQGNDLSAVDAKGKLLKSVTETGEDFGSLFFSLYYENNILLKINSGEKDNYIDRGQLMYDKGKISKTAYGQSPRGINNPEDFAYNYDFESPDIYLTTISYVGNSIHAVSQYFNETFNLNNQKQVISITENNSLTDEFTYSNNEVIKQKHFVGPRKGEYTFTYDDKVNPFYVLYTKFGLLDNAIYVFLYDNTIHYNLMPNNITKVYLDGSLFCSFIYQYDSENYPLSVVQYNYSNNETSQFKFVYTK
jgi:hypothetical protein